MADAYQSIRELSFSAVATALDIDLAKFSFNDSKQEWVGPCPIHGSKKNTNSFRYHLDGRFNCFSQGCKGRGSIDLVIAVKKINFRDAVELLSQFVASPGFKDPRPEIREAGTTKSENEPFKGSYSKYFVKSEWLEKRGFEPRTLERFGVGQYDNPARKSLYKGKILLPVFRMKDAALVAYLARTPEPKDGEAKYIWPKGFAKHLELFGGVQLQQDHKVPIRYGFLVESPFTVMAFWQKGFPAASPFGWSLSAEQTAILASLAKGWIFLPDQNKRAEATQYAGELSKYCWVKMPDYPAQDPEQLTADQIKNLT